MYLTSSSILKQAKSQEISQITPLDIADGQFSFACQATTFWLSSLKVNVEHGSI